MNAGASPAADNIRHLEQGIELIRLLDDAAFSHCPESPFPGGVGAQMRHCIDFYDCLVGSLAGGRIDYNHRRRDPRTETDRNHAVDQLRKLIGALERLDEVDADRELLIRTEESTAADGRARWSHSSVRRELEFLLSHTIHHYALVVLLLRLRGFRIPDELNGFGVAPSTVRHWKESGSPAG